MNFNFVNKYQNNIFSVSIWASAFILICLLIFRFALIFSFNAEFCGIDNNFVYSVQRLMQGFDLYTDPEQLPYAINMYTPFYFSISAFIGNIFHINPDEPINIYRLCRSVSLVCDITTCVFLFRILSFRFKATIETTLLTLSIFAAIICFWGFTFSRTDSMVLTFYASVIYFLTSPKIEEKKTLLVIALLSMACIFSKQSGIVVPLIVISWLWFQTNIKSILFYLLFFVIIFAGMIALYRYGMNYTYFFDNTVKAIQNSISLPWFYSYVFKQALNSLWILPFYIAILICLKEWTKENKEGKALFTIYIIQFFFSFVISLKIGSSVGYFTECLFLALLIITRYFINNKDLHLSKKAFGFLIPLILLFTFHTIAQGYFFYLQKRNEKKELYTKQKEIRDYLQPKLGTHFVFNLYNPNNSFFKTLFSRTLAAPNLDILYLATIPDGTFDYSNLEKDLNNGNISFLISSVDEPVTSFFNMSLLNYKKDTVINGIAIYKFQKP